MSSGTLVLTGDPKETHERERGEVCVANLGPGWNLLTALLCTLPPTPPVLFREGGSKERALWVYRPDSHMLLLGRLCSSSLLPSPPLSPTGNNKEIGSRCTCWAAPETMLKTSEHVARGHRILATWSGGHEYQRPHEHRAMSAGLCLHLNSKTALTE
jgi:hypothetical protein